MCARCEKNGWPCSPPRASQLGRPKRGHAVTIESPRKRKRDHGSDIVQIDATGSIVLHSPIRIGSQEDIRSRIADWYVQKVLFDSGAVLFDEQYAIFEPYILTIVLGLLY